MKFAEIPTESCMFAKLPRPAGSGREREQELLYAFEAVIPLPIDQCQLAFTEAGEFVIGCACIRAELEPFRGTYERAIPAELPDWIQVDDGKDHRARLNLLTGEMRSLIQIRRQESTLKISCVALLLIAILVWIVTARQVESWSRQSQIVREDIRALYNAVLPTVNGNAQPDPIRFATLMNQLSSTRTGAQRDARHELVSELSALLSDWPVRAQAQVRLISLDQNEIRVEISLPDNERALSVLEYLNGRDGWEIRSREISPVAERIDLRVTIERQAGGSSDA